MSNLIRPVIKISTRGAVEEALRYWPQGQEFDSRLCHLNFSLNVALRSTQPLTEKGTRNISWEVKAAGA